MTQRRLLSALVATAALVPALLAGCGAPGAAGLGSVAGLEANGFDALAKAKKKFGLGAITKGAPKVTFDEETGAGKYEVLAALPEKVDLRKQCPPVYNQGPIGSCTAFAIAKGLGEFILKKQNRHTELSALAFYYAERKQMGTLNEDSGAYISVGLKTLDNLGAAPETAHPYLAPSLWNNEAAVKDAYMAKPDNADIEAGKKFRVAGAKSLTSLRAIRKAVADGLPAVFGIEIYDSFYGEKVGKTGVVPMPTEKEKLQGGHAVTCVGYDNAKQVLIMRNSWGADWGDKGYFYLPYQFVKAGLVSDAWTAKI